jgi:hypothetical protein
MDTGMALKPTIMTTDIVERLRATLNYDTPARYPEIVTAAAAEIERLRAALEIAHGALLWIAGTDSNWSKYANEVADDVAPALAE